MKVKNACYQSQTVAMLKCIINLPHCIRCDTERDCPEYKAVGFEQLHFSAMRNPPFAFRFVSFRNVIFDDVRRSSVRDFVTPRGGAVVGFQEYRT